MTISHTIRRSDASWISFGAPIDEWQIGDDGKKIHIKDKHARYSNLTWVVKNVDDPPAKLAPNGQKTKTYSVEVELWCTVEASYTTTVTVDGETITYEDKGQLQFLLKTDTAKFECTHSKHAE